MAVRTPKIGVTVEPVGREEVGFSVEVARRFSADHPAALDVALSNESDRERTFLLGGAPPFSRLGTRNVLGNGSLTLVPDGRFSEQAAETASRYADAIPNAPGPDGCWRAAEMVAVGAVARPYSLAPGETFRGGYAVLAGRESEACLPPGRYEFEDAVTVGAADPDESDVFLRFAVTIGDE